MPRIDREQIGVAFDMQGCPNRCRHCWLGCGSKQILSEEDVRWGVARFRAFLARGHTPVKRLSVATWFREPDCRDDYRDLYRLEAELSDGKPWRYELLSVWRLARDTRYAAWARTIGPDTCQISFFGLRETNDWFFRRKGAFADALLATQRLLDAGIKPRWQVFLTTKVLPELDALLGLVDEYRLRERVQTLGASFEIFLHLPSPDYEGRWIEAFRPTVAQVAHLPEAILASTRKHLSRNVLWHAERDLYAEIVTGADASPGAGLPDVLWFFVRSDWDVYANVGTLEDWWRLGNLKQDAVESITRRFENDTPLGLNTFFRGSSAALARQYGDPYGQKIYSGKGDLLALYHGGHCEELWATG